MIETFIIYNFILLSSTTLIFYSEKCRYHFDRNILLFLAWSIVFIPAAIRYNIGIDYRGYVAIYNAITENQSSYVEPGFKTLIQLVKSIFDNATGLFVITSALIYYLVFKAYPNKKAYIINYVFIGMFYLLSYTFIRSYIVLGFTLLAVMIYLQYKKYALLKFFFLIILATLFHKSAIILLVLPLFQKKLMPWLLKKYNLIILALLMLILIFRFQLVDLIIYSPLIEMIGYSHYLTNEHYMKRVTLGSGLGVLFKIIILLLPIIFAKQLINFNPRFSIIISSCIYAFIALSLGLTYFIFDRIQYLFFFAYFLSPYSVMIVADTSKHKLIIKMFTYIILLGIFILFQKEISSNQSSFCEGHRSSPYVTIFNKSSDQSLEYLDSKCEF